MTLSLDQLNQWGAGYLPGLLGIEFLDVAEGRIVSRLEVEQRHHAPNGYLHAATVVALADTSCGYGCFLSLPEDATGFTTLELNSNFTGTVREGGIRCEARLAHAGRSTQVWDATVSSEASDKPIALFRCTQLLLYQKAPSPTST